MEKVPGQPGLQRDLFLGVCWGRKADKKQTKDPKTRKKGRILPKPVIEGSVVAVTWVFIFVGTSRILEVTDLF